MRALIDLPSRLGELVVDIAVMQTLVKGLGDCAVEVVVSENMAGLVEDCSFIHKRHLHGRGKMAQYAMANFSALSREWDVYLQMRKRGPLRWCRPWMRSLAYRPPPQRTEESSADKNMWERRLGVLDGLVTDYMDTVETHIPLLSGRIEHAQEIVGVKDDMRYMTVAPGADRGRLPWPVDKAVKVVNAIKDDFDRVLVLGRAGNGALCRRVAEATGGTAVAGNLPFPYALGLMSRASFHIGSDTCMAQVAAAYGVSTLCVGGPRDGYLRPWKQHQLVGNPEGIDADEILAKAKQILQ